MNQKNESNPRPMRGDGTYGFEGVNLEKVTNVWGSTAGAGSDFFHLYRRHRATEMERVNDLEENYQKQKEQKEFELIKNLKNKVLEEKTRQKRIKRQRKKENTKKHKATEKVKKKSKDGPSI